MPSDTSHADFSAGLAHDTFEFVADLERHLDQTGMDPMVLGSRFDLWRDQGIAFWKIFSG